MKRSELKIGQSVIISPRENRNSSVQGTIKEVLTRAEDHPHGILVKLDSGVIGRVKNIISKIVQTPELSSDHLLKGEGQDIEYKSSALWSQDFSKKISENKISSELQQYGRDASKFIIARVIASFLNTKGGQLVIGIKEDKNTFKETVIGIDSEIKKLADKNYDGYKRMIVDQIIRKYLPSDIYNHFPDFFNINFKKMEDKTVCVITTQPSSFKVFITWKNKNFFYIRTESECRELVGEELVNYCQKHF